MKTKTLLPLMTSACLALAATLPAQDNFRELGATPAPAASAAAAKPANKASFNNDSSKGTTTARVSFSDKTKPGALKINVAAAEIEVEGTSGNEVVVISTLDKKDAPKVDDDGFRRLDQEVSFDLDEKDNIATLRITGGNPWLAAGAEFKVKVPRNTSLSIKTQSSKEVEIHNIDGDIEVATTAGEINLENIGGSVIANTMSGKIDAEFKRAPTKPVSLTAMNGGITLSVPPATAANLRMRTMNGTIRTNFPENALKTTTPERSSTAAKKVEMQVTADGASGVTVITSSDGSSYSYTTSSDGSMPVPPLPPVPPATPATPSDGELVQTIIETRKAQALDYADKGLAAAQKGITAAVEAIDNIKGLSPEEKELIKRKIQSGGNAIPRSVRVAHVPMVGGKTITGQLNGGGIEIQLTTMNGAITLKQEK